MPGKKPAMSQAQRDQRATSLNPNQQGPSRKSAAVPTLTQQAHQRDQRATSLNPNQQGLSRKSAAVPTLTQAQRDQRANQLKLESVAFQAARKGAVAHTGQMSKVSSGHFQATAQQVKGKAQHSTAHVLVIESIARVVFGSNTHLKLCGSQKNKTYTSGSDSDFRMDIERDATRSQRNQFVQRLQEHPEVVNARAKTNAISIAFLSGAEMDVVPMQVAYSSEQPGFQQHKQHFYSPQFQQFPGLQHAATIARIAFQAAAKGYELDNAVLKIAKTYPSTASDLTGKAVFDRLVASGANAIELHEDPKGKSLKKRRAHLKQLFGDLQNGTRSIF